MLASRKAVMAGPVVALVTLLAAVIVTAAAGVPLRDPGHVSAVRLLVAGSLVAILVAADAQLRERPWPARRILPAAIALVSFFVTYFAYRNLKSVVPLLEPGRLFDDRLAGIDRDLLGGHAPAALLHDALGSGIAAHILSTVYMAFFVFIPVVLATALVLVRDQRAGLFLTTALSLNWPLAAATYYLLPSIGPFHQDPGTFASLPATAVGRLQDTLIAGRADFLHHPGAAGAAQSIGAFASLHVSIYATAALGTHALGLPRALKISAWALTGLTAIATVYFGWHYLVDDLAGLLIAGAALGVAWMIAGAPARHVQPVHPGPRAATEMA
jgi:hypothetical protein